MRAIRLPRLQKTGNLELEAAHRVEELKQLTINIALELRRVATDPRPLREPGPYPRGATLGGNIWHAGQRRQSHLRVY